ncbi:MAG: hypothetical protein ACLQVX_03460 [Limisphaerales bacterium]
MTARLICIGYEVAATVLVLVSHWRDGDLLVPQLTSETAGYRSGQPAARL